MTGAVVVTGASTGIGAETARALRASGFDVFGTIRRHQDGPGLEETGAQPVTMDVTDAASIARAHDTVVAALGEHPLVGLVNNAGIPVAGPLEHLPLNELRRVLEVNVIGAVAVTQAFLPELRRARGRIVNVSSISGRVALPFMGPYAASKFALEAISDSLRRELIPSGVAVIVIEPGTIRTPIWSKVEAISLEPYRGTTYEKVLDRVLPSAVARADRGLPTAAVAKAIVTALTARRPKPRIPVVRSRLRMHALRLLPDRWIDREVARRLWS